ncbi:outer membrane beta-barrel protein [Rhodocytophaga rosea]|uniref:Outer membrane beta-barrel protein n=1 Tax=Rhodocytophaga rosea TaxID=2704465 RepID=A0A6C0GEB6_9BACT|nr:outer membrane beta-barrel protein [Rhodocytophaga rosea]QHT66325.1 outer membrane beta-barrel protein [Rhodocytophaga rosea]
MSTPDIPEDELDDFFRKSLGNPDLDFREEDWLKMEQKLKDNNARERAFYRRFLYSLLGLLLVMAPVLTWYFVSRPTQSAVPTVAVREHENTENSIGNTNTPNNTGNTNIPDSKNDVNPGLAPDSKQVMAEKEDENKPDIISPSGNRTEPIAEKEGLKQKNIPQQDESLTKEQPIKSIPSVKQKTGDTGIIAAIQEHNGKEKNPKKTTIKQSDLPSGKPEQDEKSVNPKVKKLSKGNGLDEQLLTQSQLNKPIEKQPSTVTESGVIVIDPSSNKQLSENNNEKDDTNSPISGKFATKKDTQEQAINNTNGEPTGILPRQNSQEGSHSIPKEAVTPESEHSNTQPTTFYLIESISSLSIRPLSYNIQLSDLITQQAIPLTQPELIDSTRRKKLAIERVHSRLSVNLLLSPDLSSIGFSKWRTPGTNIGASLEYHISNKLSISVGAIYSTKIYEADAKKYNPASSYWASYYPKPVDVKGNCKVIDLPVNIRYNFLGREKYNLYISSGISSYLMLKEDYKYIYKVYDSSQRKGWHGENENKHFFKVINLSAGYERKISQRFSFQAEPFIKLPTAGVGYGRIKLLSTGLFMSMKYNF